MIFKIISNFLGVNFFLTHTVYPSCEIAYIHFTCTFMGTYYRVLKSLMIHVCIKFVYLTMTIPFVFQFQ